MDALDKVVLILLAGDSSKMFAKVLRLQSLFLNLFLYCIK